MITVERPVTLSELQEKELLYNLWGYMDMHSHNLNALVDNKTKDKGYLVNVNISDITEGQFSFISLYSYNSIKEGTILGSFDRGEVGSVTAGLFSEDCWHIAEYREGKVEMMEGSFELLNTYLNEYSH